MKRLARLAGLGALAGTLAAAAPAAAFTSSDITTPGDLTHVFVDGDSSAGTLDVSGTTQGAVAGDKVDIACAGPAGFTPAVLKSDVPVDIPAGTFSTSVQTSGLDYRTPCVLRAEPAGSGTSAEPPGTASSFTGPRLLVGGRFTHHLNNDPNKPVNNFSTDTAKPAGKWHHEVTGSCAISSAGLFDTTTLTTGPLVFSCNAWVLNQNRTETDSVGTRSQLQVDGVNAYLPGGLVTPNAPHYPSVSVASFSFDPANGDITEHTVEPVVHCAGTDPNPYPATSSNCPDVTTSGVQVHTFITTRGDGTRSLVVQRFESTDGGTHQIDALFDQEFSHPNGGPAGFRFPWVDSAYRRYDVDNTVTPPPAGPGSMFAKDDRTATDGTLAGSQGGETWAAAPDSILFLVGTDSPNSVPELETGYHRTVGPSAPTWFGWAFGMGTTPASVQSAAHDAEVSFTPRVAVSAPADGSSTTDETAHVTGTSSDDSGDPVAVSVNGHDATVGAGGAWSVDLPLALGANTFIATATNRYGATSAAQTTVTRTTPPPGPGPGPTPSPHLFSGAIYVGQRTLRVSRSGVVVLPVRCPAAALGKCSGTLSLRGGKPSFRFGSKTFQTSTGTTVRVRVHLARRARRLIGRHSRVVMHLTLASSDTGAVAVPRHWALTLRPPLP